jgi:hypothetical protein
MAKLIFTRPTKFKDRIRWYKRRALITLWILQTIFTIYWIFHG